ncbi:IclR family transcriptional regulator [Bordetella sp. BOR01]|uniref:IclR family transcriptional regulator n=1 Tax=Bordetella sp. BOR01 TaxID=2854779 RepID=UPI001C48CAD7|nr:IclR family transcriptional regulator [Bordetella sp. BOR01]MBV7482437.1 IclR family transcriptional regulator [Bordetella sp. BOR01]
MAESALFIQSLEKGLAVLQAFRANETMNLREIAQACDITSGSAQRVAYTLEQCGYLKKDSYTKRYRVTVKAVGLGYSYLAREPLFQNAHAVLHQLNQECGEIVNLSVPDETDHMVFVMRVPTSKHIPVYMPVGTRIPMHASSSGRAMLAYLPPDELERKLATAAFQKHTPHTTIDQAMLRRLIDEARQNRYAYADEEFFQGDVNVAATVMNEDSQPIAAINISVPKPRWSLERARLDLGPLVIRAARAISKNAT